METLGLDFVKDPHLDRYVSKEIPIPMLAGQGCRIVLEGYDGDVSPRDFRTAIVNLLAAKPSVLREVEPHLYHYYQDWMEFVEPDEDDYVVIDEPAEVWRHIELGNELVVSRRSSGDRGIYVSLESECDWEPEHGLQIVLKNGERVVKVGPYDGHLTNADVYDDESLADMIYWPG